MTWGLALIAASAAALGQSPIAESGHQHAWTQVFSGDAGYAWLDTNSAGSEIYEGTRLQLALFRIDLHSQFQGDYLFAMDCETGRYGLKTVHFHTIFGSDEERVTPETFEMVEAGYFMVDQQQSRDLICGEKA